METLTRTETTFYRDAQILVTQSRYVANSKTYAMRNISSVHIFEVVKSKKLPITMIVIGLLMLCSASGRIYGLLATVAGAALLFLTKNDYAVRISTNSGEVDSFISKDHRHIQKIVNALNEAIIHRG